MILDKNVKVYNKLRNNEEYTFVSVDNIDDIPSYYVVWNCNFGNEKQIPMVRTIGTDVDTSKNLYFLEVGSKEVKDLIMDNSMYYGKDKQTDVKQQLRLLEV